MTDPQDPVPAFAVSPTDKSSDRQQSDDDNTTAANAQTAATSERAAAKAQAATDQAITLDRLDRIEAAANAQTASNDALALAMVEYQERARLARRRFRLTIVALIATTAVLLAGLVLLLSKMNDNLTSGSASRAQIRDCITPQGKCYQDGQKRTAAVLGNVQKIIVLAAACAPNYVTLPIPERTAAIEQCIEKGLK